ncbi:hypothetical protein LSAT2_030044 [Lamellibrachia satsuma]|nr:hypothetical protein LSAT2_030044 [Lamellibrachia satsuma]
MIGLLELKTKTLYEQMRPYYVHIASEHVATPLLTVPYFDDNINEPMIAISIPAFHRHRFIGVVGTAMSLRELAIQQKSDFSYLYVIRLSDSAALYHPMLDIPTDGDEDSVVLNIRVLEREADENGIHDSMRRGGHGYKTITSTQYRSSGYAYLDGADVVVHNATYIWHGVSGFNQSVCAVITSTTNDHIAGFKEQTQQPVHYTYHNVLANEKRQEMSFFPTGRHHRTLVGEVSNVTVYRTLGGEVSNVTVYRTLKS